MITYTIILFWTKDIGVTKINWPFEKIDRGAKRYDGEDAYLSLRNMLIMHK